VVQERRGRGEPKAAADVPPEYRDLIGKRVGNFVLSSVLGQGGMGAVLLAEHPALGKRVAVKFLSRMLASMPEMSARFLDEARSAASLQHPNIVDILDFGEMDRQPYYVMEHLPGTDLSKVLATRKRMPSAEVGDYVEQIASALEVAHARGIIHRDLKPANVFVREGSPLRVKLLDFGIAKVMDSRTGVALTQSGQVMGTPSHMAPEQALGAVREICPQTDLYSLGVILYEMLTGRPLYAHESPVVVMMMHIRDPFVPVRDVAPEVPQGVARVVEWCLAKSPDKRPPSARELARAFAQAVRDAATQATPPARAAGQGGAPARAPAPAAAPAPAPPAAAGGLAHAPTVAATADPAPVPLPAPALASNAEVDKIALDRILKKMQAKGDFPAFMKNVTEISQKAHPGSALSASGLAESILKDYALTAKLLRVVNSAYYERLGKRVNNVSRAVVVLGFEKVRSMALAIALNRNQGKKVSSQETSELSIQALVSGEIARRLAPSLGIADAEEAQVCAMFQNVGQQLLVHYLPDDYAKVKEVMAAQGTSLEVAAGQVLGVPLRALGVGMAQRWRLSERVAESMVPAEVKGKPANDGERLRVLSTFSNELSDTVARTNPVVLESALAGLMERYKGAVPVHPARVPELLGAVQKSFNDRYASLLNLDPAASKFCQNASTVTGLAPDGSAPDAKAVDGKESAKAETPQERASRLDRRLDEIETVLSGPHQPREVVRRILEIFGTELGFRRALVLVPGAERGTLEVQSAWGEDAKMLEAELVLPFGASATSDVIASAYHGGKEEIVVDAFDAKATSRVPRVYYEMIGSVAFAIYPCGVKGAGYKLLFADTDSPARLPGTDRSAHIARFREILGRRALASSVVVDARRKSPRS
jgi:HD-like signal output (HDOD) protein